MSFEYFKDNIFDLLNEADNIGISDIECFDKKSIFKVSLQTGEIYEVECRQAQY